MMTTAEFVEKATLKHGDVKFDYFDSRYLGFHHLVKVHCIKHGVFDTNAKTHFHTITGGCSFWLSEAI